MCVNVNSGFGLKSTYAAYGLRNRDLETQYSGFTVDLRSVRIFRMPYTGSLCLVFQYKCIHAQSIRFPCTAYGIFERTVNPLYAPFEYSVCRTLEAYALFLNINVCKHKAYASFARHTEYSNGT